MTKAYWIARATVKDPEGYKRYLEANGAAFKKFGGRFVVRGGNYEVMAGEGRDRNVVIEFKDFDTAIACYNSPEYKRAIEARGNSADIDLIVIEGYDGPQPS